MPELSRFLGMVITMYFDDHPPPHFHVRYAEFRAAMAVDSGNLIAGVLPPRVASLAAEWAALHRQELYSNWTILAAGGKVVPIEPLT